jgi:3-isopropylmalate/(R)-2-methylmalate dehydratase large subunit
MKRLDVWLPQLHSPQTDRTLRMTGHALFLTEDPTLRTVQLTGESGIHYGQLLKAPLLDNISTDEIIPGWCCYWYDEKLGDFAYIGLRDNVIGEGAMRQLSPQIIVSGESKGCGSSREHAVYAERYAGVEIVFAKSFEKIYEQNCRNVGIITCTDFDILQALIAGEELPLSAFTKRFNEIERTIVDAGGLFGYSRRAKGRNSDTATRFGPQRPLNCIEKIIQRHLSDANSLPEQASVRVSESYFVRTDVRFSHEYTTPMAAEMFVRHFGPDAALTDPQSVYFFQDHLSLADEILRRRPNGVVLTERVRNLHDRQRQFAQAMGGRFVGPLPAGGSEAICHNYILENVAKPGQIIVGTDSHTCTAGALGAFAFGVGSTDIANAWYTSEILTKVPEVVQIRLEGKLRRGVCAKDVMLTLLAHPVVHEGGTRSRVLVFSGPGCDDLNTDERATLCNMAVEARGMTGCFEPDDANLRSDDGASFAESVEIDLGAVVPMVALPGDPTNSVPLTTIGESISVNKVYGGSCTGGKFSDMDMYASVLKEAQLRGMTVSAGTEAYIQMGSTNVMRYAVDRGYVELFEQIGVKVLPPSCGACINAGPGVSESADDVTVSAQNRNFPGRSGPGSVYLASPYVVAASAISGRLCSPEELFDTVEAPCE